MGGLALETSIEARAAPAAVLAEGRPVASGGMAEMLVAVDMAAGSTTKGSGVSRADAESVGPAWALPRLPISPALYAMRPMASAPRRKQPPTMSSARGLSD